MTKTNYFKVSVVFLAAVLATGLLVLAGTPREAGAVFPGRTAR